MASSPLEAVAAALAWLLATTGYLLWLSRRAEALLAAVREHGPPGLWEELGAPASLQEVAADPQRRWQRFVREKAYRTRCDPLLAARIEEFAWSVTRGLLLMTGSGLGVLLWVRPYLDLP